MSSVTFKFTAMLYTKTSDMETGDTVLEINAFIMKTYKSLMIHKLKLCSTYFYRQIFLCLMGGLFLKAIDITSWPFPPLLHKRGKNQTLFYPISEHFWISVQLNIILDSFLAELNK